MDGKFLQFRHPGDDQTAVYLGLRFYVIEVEGFHYSNSDEGWYMTGYVRQWEGDIQERHEKEPLRKFRLEHMSDIGEMTEFNKVVDWMKHDAN
jgi:hypothetical protein